MQGTEDHQIQQNEPIASITPRYEADTIRQIGNPWSTGLFDCHENQTNAVMTSFFPLSSGELHLPINDACFVLSMDYGVKVPRKVEEEEFRELKIRGLDPALGWNGILAQQHGRQQSNQTLKNPPSNQFMSK
ncbi:Protein PLANT CADMIUM RESISTANCE 8, partial [Mucuna pruriens]